MQSLLMNHLKLDLMLKLLILNINKPIFVLSLLCFISIIIRETIPTTDNNAPTYCKGLNLVFKNIIENTTTNGIVETSKSYILYIFKINLNTWELAADVYRYDNTNK